MTTATLSTKPASRSQVSRKSTANRSSRHANQLANRNRLQAPSLSDSDACPGPDTLESPAAAAAIRKTASRYGVGNTISRQTLEQLQRWHALFLTYRQSIREMMEMEPEAGRELGVKWFWEIEDTDDEAKAKAVSADGDFIFDLNSEDNEDFDAWLLMIEERTGKTVL